MVETDSDTARELDAVVRRVVRETLGAAVARVEPLAELMLYVAHGILHLAGWDDRNPEDARRMQEEAIGTLTALGYRNE